jgi:hypothetical protein
VQVSVFLAPTKRETRTIYVQRVAIVTRDARRICLPDVASAARNLRLRQHNPCSSRSALNRSCSDAEKSHHIRKEKLRRLSIIGHGSAMQGALVANRHD